MTQPGLSAAGLREVTATVTVPTRLGDFEAEYRVYGMNADTQADYFGFVRILNKTDATEQEQAEAQEDLVSLFCEIVVRTNLLGPLYDGDGTELVAAGEPVPMEPDLWMLVPSRLINDTFTAMSEDQADDREAQGKSRPSATRPSKRRSRRGSFGR